MIQHKITFIICILFYFYEKDEDLMPIRTKYRAAIDLMKELNVKDLKVWEDEGELKIRAIAKNYHDKSLIINKIAEENIDDAQDVEAKIEVEED